MTGTSTNCLKEQHNLCGYANCDCRCHGELTAETVRMVNNVELERICNRLLVDQDAVPTRIETDYLLSPLAQRAPTEVDVRVRVFLDKEAVRQAESRQPNDYYFGPYRSYREEGQHDPFLRFPAANEIEYVQMVAERNNPDLQPLSQGFDDKVRMATEAIAEIMGTGYLDLRPRIAALITTYMGQPATERARAAADAVAALYFADDEPDERAKMAARILPAITRHSASLGDSGDLISRTAARESAASVSMDAMGKLGYVAGNMGFENGRAKAAAEISFAIDALPSQPAGDGGEMRAAIEKIRDMDAHSRWCRSISPPQTCDCHVAIAITALEEMERGV